MNKTPDGLDPVLIKRAAEILARGGLVAFATETVYGLGADATNPAAVEKIFIAKGRPPGNPLIVHIADAAAARRYAAEWPRDAERLAHHFWPGPLTMVVKAASSIVPAVTAGLSTVGLRAPDHPLAQALLRQFDGPLAAPSANRSSRISPTTAAHVRAELGSSADLILDGGPCRIGIESTVISLADGEPSILRPGHIDRASIESIIGRVRETTAVVDPSAASASPGQQAIHYAPTSKCLRFERDEFLAAVALGKRESNPPRVLIAISDDIVASARSGGVCVHMLSRDPAGYARELYAVLRTADESKPPVIWIEMPPDRPQWRAVRDRLTRASRAFSPTDR